MSGFTFENHPDKPIISAILTEEYSVKRDQPPLLELIKSALDSADRSKYLIIDVTNIRITFEDLVAGVNEAARGSGSASLHHANFHEMIVVSPSPVWHLTARGLTTSTFGHISVRAINTLAEAIAYVDEQTR
jgi:hypothetical protein